MTPPHEEEDSAEDAVKPRRRSSDHLAIAQQPVSLQQAIGAAIVTALLGGGLGAGGGISFGASVHEHADYVAARDLQRVEEKVDKLDAKAESLNSKLVDLRIALAQRGIANVTAP